MPWAARRKNKSVLEDIKPAISLEAQLTRLQHTWTPHEKGKLVRERHMLGKVEGQRVT